MDGAEGGGRDPPKKTCVVQRSGERGPAFFGAPEVP